jgi:hypothetical protein
MCKKQNGFLNAALFGGMDLALRNAFESDCPPPSQKIEFHKEIHRKNYPERVGF